MQDTIADHIWYHNIFARPTRDRQAGLEEATSDQERHYWNRENIHSSVGYSLGFFVDYSVISQFC